MKIKKPWVSWEELEEIVGGAWSPAAHTHEKADITDTPWAWADVLKAGSNLTDLATRQHAGLSDAPADAHHPQAHAASHHVAGADLLAFASITGFGTYIDQAILQASHVIHASVTVGNEGLHVLDLGADHDLIIKPGTDLGADRILTLTTGDAARTITLSGNPTLADWFDQAVKQASSPVFATVKLSGLTDNFVPYHVDDATGLADSPIQISGVEVGIGKVPTEKLDVDGIVKATTFEGNLHWDFLTNTPVAYPPEFHWHVGREIKSLHLVDTTDDRDPPGDPLDVLTNGAIHGQGTYDWFGTWVTAADANCSAEIAVLAGADKYLRLTDNNNAGKVGTTLTATSGREMVTGVAEFQMRTSETDKFGYFAFYKGAVFNFAIYFNNNGQIRFMCVGGVAQDLQAYVANVWYRIRVHFDHVARQCVIFIDNAFNSRQALDAGVQGTYVDKLYIYTEDGSTGYTFDVNELKLFNLTV